VNKKRTKFSTSIITLLVTLFLITSFVSAQDLAIKTHVDRIRIAVGQQFVLTVELSGAEAQSLSPPNPPDLSAFADFAGNSSSTNMQFINGKMSVIKGILNYYIARKQGKHQIPAISFDYKGKTLTSQPITIEILKGAAQPQTTPDQRRNPSQRSQITPQDQIEGNIFLKAEVDKKSVYQNEPVTIIYKIYTRLDVSNYAIAKLPNTLGFWSEDFSIPQRPVTYEEVINGERFLVAEVKKYALFPTDAGKKIIEPMEIECEVRVRQRRQSRDIFDRFFDDDFFGSSFGQRVRTKVFSDTLKIDVKPLPLEGKPADFSGAVGNFSMNASIDKDEVVTNDAITLKVRYSGDGNIKMLPEPIVNIPNDIETYPPKTNQNIDRTGDRIKGNKTTEYVMIPRYAGEYRIKPITFSYFDTDNKTYKTLRSPEFKIRVSAGTGTGLPITSGISREEIKLIGKDIRFIKESTAEFHRIGSYFYKTFWFGLFIFIPLFAFGFAIVYRQRQDKMSENVAYARSRRANQFAKKRLSKAHKLKDTETRKEFYTEISQALLGFIADKLNLAAAGLISDDVADRLRERNVDESVISELLSCLQECDYQRFAPSDISTEEMKELYNKASDAIVSLDKAKLS